MAWRAGLLAAFVIQLCVFVFGYTPVDYIDNYCGQTIKVKDAVRIKLRRYSWPSEETCEVTLTGSNVYSLSDARILVRFRHISLDSGLLGKCKYSYVDIVDSDGGKLSDDGGTCGSFLPFAQPWTSTGNSLTIRLKRLMSRFFATGSFEILATRFSTGICDTDGEFDCNNGRCVSNDVTCDGYDNCGDYSDEIKGCHWTPALIAGVVVACIIGFIIFVVVAVVCYRQRTYGRILRRQKGLYCQGGTAIQTTTTGMVVAPQYGTQQPTGVYTTPTLSPPYPQYPKTGAYQQ